MVHVKCIYEETEARTTAFQRGKMRKEDAGDLGMTGHVKEERCLRKE